MQSLNELTTNASGFIDAIVSLSADISLKPMDDAWSPREVTAHLAWWNNNMLAGCKYLQNGRAPSYQADNLNEYRNLNAWAIAQFLAQERRMLFAQLESTLFEFQEYLTSVDAKDGRRTWRSASSRRCGNGQPHR